MMGLYVFDSVSPFNVLGHYVSPPSWHESETSMVGVARMFIWVERDVNRSFVSVVDEFGRRRSVGQRNLSSELVLFTVVTSLVRINIV